MRVINQDRVAWHDQALWALRAKRDHQAQSVPEWEELRETALKLKLYSNSHLEELLLQFEAAAQKNGAIVHWAADAKEYREIIHEILASHGVRNFVKSKSMLAEECELNPYLVSKGIDVVETDLGERIIQLRGEKPSHIVVPAIHIKKEEVGELFEREMGTEKGNSDPTYLTHAARRALREKFENADAAMTGGNFAVASTGEVVVCTNEGNADMGTSFAPLQIAAFGIDKIVPDREALGVFTRLLARSGTGQPITTYTSHYSKPKKGSEFHIVIVDNGRSQILANKEHYRLLNCLRCGACINTCPVYRRTGGYAYSYFIPGPIGVNLGSTRDAARYHKDLSACSLCHSCQDVCPVKMNLADQIYSLRQQHTSALSSKAMISGVLSWVFNHPTIYNIALGAAPLGTRIMRALHIDWGRGRRMPQAKKRFRK